MPLNDEESLGIRAKHANSDKVGTLYQAYWLDCGEIVEAWPLRLSFYEACVDFANLVREMDLS